MPQWAARVPSLLRGSWRRHGWKVVWLAVGLFLLLPLFGFATQCVQGGSAVAAPPVCWSDFQSYLSRHLAITLAEADVLAQAAWGAAPAPETPLTVDQVRAIEAVINQKEEEKIRLIPSDLAEGPLRQNHLVPLSSSRSDAGRFTDVPLDHPVYLAWRALLQLELPLADDEGRARPFEPVLGNDWRRLLTALFQTAGVTGTPTPPRYADPAGPMTGDDLRRSLLEVRSVLGLPLSDRGLEASLVDRHPTRLEAFGVLSDLLMELEHHGRLASR